MADMGLYVRTGNGWQLKDSGTCYKKTGSGIVNVKYLHVLEVVGRRYIPVMLVNKLTQEILEG